MDLQVHTGLSASAIALCEVASLDHEVLDNTMKGRVLVSVTLLSGSQSAEVLHSLGDGLAVQAHHDTSQGLVTMADVEVDLVGDFGTFHSLGGLREEGKGDEEDQERRDDEALHGEHREVQLVVLWMVVLTEVVGLWRGERRESRAWSVRARVSDRCRLRWSRAQVVRALTRISTTTTPNQSSLHLLTTNWSFYSSIRHHGKLRSLLIAYATMLISQVFILNVNFLETRVLKVALCELHTTPNTS